MARTTPKQPAMAEIFQQMREFAAFNPMIGPQIEHFWEAQEKILDESETFARNWFERRHEATRSAMSAAKGVTRAGSTDPATAARALADWHSRSLERMAEDLRDWFDMCSRCAGHLTRAEIEAGEDALNAAARQAPSARPAGDSVPV